MCQAGCEIVADVEGGKLVRVTPDRESPRGRLCPRGALSPSLVHSSQRLTTPLLRTGERGKGEFREVTWNEAIDKIYEQWSGVIKEYGGKALASYFGRGVLGDPVSRFNGSDDSFLSHLGSPNDMNSGSICNYSSNVIAPLLTMGITMSSIAPDIQNSECVFVWGKNPVTDDGPQQLLKNLRQAKERGAEIIVIDPRGAGIAEESSRWIPIYPGTDGALALAMLKIILESGRYDKEFADRHVLGFQEFLQYIADQDITELCNTCRISEETLNQLVSSFCATEKCSFIAYTGWEYQLSGMQNFRMLFLLWALTGKLDVPGGQLITGESLPEYVYAAKKEIMPIGAEKYPLFYRILGIGQFNQLPRAVLEGFPYTVRGLMIVGGSPACTFPGGDLWQRTYRSLDSLVVLDRYMTEECLYADVVLPSATLYENECVCAAFSHKGLRLRKQLIPPVGQSKNDVFILAAIADRFGFGEKYPHDSDELILWQLGGDRKKAAHLREYGIWEPQAREQNYKKYDTGLLRNDGKPGFPTPSGKFEIVSTIAEQCGLVGYPKYQDVSDFACDQFPLMMTSGARSKLRTGSFGANMPEIAAIEPIPYAEMSAATAQTCGVSNGDLVRLSSAFGAGQFTAKITPMAEGAIGTPHGGGSSLMPKAWREGNANALCSPDFADHVTGFPLVKSIPCHLERI